MRQKYIDERFEPYFILGQHPDGRVSVTSASGQDFLLDAQAAQTLISERQAALDMLSRLAFALDEAAPEAFRRIWYGDDHPAADS